MKFKRGGKRCFPFENEISFSYLMLIILFPVGGHQSPVASQQLAFDWVVG